MAKRSTQTKSEWDTSRPYEIDTLYNATKSKSPKRYEFEMRRVVGSDKLCTIEKSYWRPEKVYKYECFYAN